MTPDHTFQQFTISAGGGAPYQILNLDRMGDFLILLELDRYYKSREFFLSNNLMDS